MNLVFRIHVAALCFVLLMGAGAMRLVYIEMSEKDFLQDQGDARTIRMERINAHRGMILDRRGNPLAVSSPVVSLWANPAQLPDDGQRLTELATGLGVSLEEFNRKMTRAEDRNFVYLRRHAKRAAASAIALERDGRAVRARYHLWREEAVIGHTVAMRCFIIVVSSGHELLLQCKG